MTENYEQKRKNIFKKQYKDIDESVLNKATWYEQQALQLRKDAGMITVIYLPQTHAIIGQNLLKKGRRLMWCEVDPEPNKKSGYRIHGTIESFSSISSKELSKELDFITLEEIEYDNEPYIKIVMIVEREETVITVHGKSEYLYIEERNGHR